ncbi:hypothetical protein [Streptomyces sp. MNP-20]|uniref:hypothetical protein n=1 Tax=Streptomyces sp. MNP-20 TaxID=2721165 RepID=UPI001554101D|nr:hypothetical protein [Streptomyces sp. MNP-20]
MAFTQTLEIRGDLTGASGRARLWVTQREPGIISLAVPGDRVTMRPEDARALARWLEEQAMVQERTASGGTRTHQRKVWA